MATKTTVKTKASDMFFLAALAYLLTLAAPIFNSFAPQNNVVVALILRIVCMAIWAFGAFGLVRTAKKDCGFEVIDVKNKPSALQWILASVLTVAFIVYCVIDGAEEYASAFRSFKNASDIIYFVSYYIMNAVQACAVALIVVFAQKGGDIAFGLGKYIPYGGIALGLCWAIAQLFTSLEFINFNVFSMLISMLWMLAYGVIFGVIYLLIGKKPIFALPLIAVAFMLM